jgi:aryl-alcohol dehydrogenase-like predicted oxidoreductase
MQYRRLGNSGLHVSLLGFGNFTFGNNWWGDFTDEQAVALQNHAVDRGVNFFDSAPAYGNGRAESLLKDTIQYAGRDHIVVSTKFGYDLVTDPGEGGHRERKQDFSPAFVRADLERSLGRMGIECIDFYQAHNLKLPAMSDDLFAVLQALVDEGKIRSWGVALGPAIGWREEGLLGIERGAAAVQTVYNLYEQDPGRPIADAAETAGSSVIARVPTNSGILDDEFDSSDHKFAANDHRKFRDRDWLVYGIQKNDIVRPMAEAAGLSLRQFAFKWLASQPAMASIEPNIVSQQDIDDFADAADGKPLPADVLQELAGLYATHFGLGTAAAPCDLKSSSADDGKVASDPKVVTPKALSPTS